MNSKYLILRIGTIIAILYSIGIIASATPSFGDIPNAVVVFYYLIIPGFVITYYFNEDYALLQRIAYSIALGLTLVLIIFSIRQVTSDSFPLPYDIIIPVVTIMLTLFSFYRLRPKVVTLSALEQ
jgi:1,4-dihydroxy-2-naphthoate octaprenyltransferase